MPCNSLTSFEYEEAFAITRLTNFAAILTRRHPYLDVLEKEQLIQLADVKRIKLALRNPGQLAPFACYLVSKIGNFAINVTEIIFAKIFCQIVGGSL